MPNIYKREWKALATEGRLLEWAAKIIGRLNNGTPACNAWLAEYWELVEDKKEKGEITANE